MLLIFLAFCVVFFFALFVFIFCFVTNVACVWIVHSWLHLCLCSFSVLWPMLPVSRLSILDYTFVCVRFLSCDQCCLCLDCPFLITPLFVFVFCFVTNVACVWIVHSWLHLCLCSFSALWPMLPVFGLSILDYTFVCVHFLFCDQCCLCLDCPFLITPLFVFVFCFVTNVACVWIVHSWLHLCLCSFSVLWPMFGVKPRDIKAYPW
jgi:hypothetical protein